MPKLTTGKLMDLWKTGNLTPENRDILITRLNSHLDDCFEFFEGNEAGHLIAQWAEEDAE